VSAIVDTSDSNVLCGTTGNLPAYVEQEVSNTMLAFAKMEHVDFALMEVRPPPMAPGDHGG